MKSNLIAILVAWLADNRSLSLKLLSESAFQIDELNSPIPDISLVFAAQANSAGRPGLIYGAPELAIEVVSSETCQPP